MDRLSAGTDPRLRATSRRDSIIMLAGLAAVTGLAWVYLFLDAARMEIGMGPPALSWTGAGLTFVMWVVMMAAMMLPSAAPAVLLYGRMVRGNQGRGTYLPAVWVFAGGYLAVWTGFSLAVTGLQAGLAAARLIGPMAAATNVWLSAAILTAAGVYQWLPLKEACLTKCRDPVTFFMMRWRGGKWGTFQMGAVHGAYCVGCCWALMILLFVAGVMNLFWVAAIAAFVFIEKLLPGGRVTARLAGSALVAAGAALPLAA